MGSEQGIVRKPEGAGGQRQKAVAGLGRQRAGIDQEQRVLAWRDRPERGLG
jgi:hypothetical protein